MAEEPLGSRVPRRDDPVEAFSDNRVLARFDDRAELGLGQRAGPRALEEMRHENDESGQHGREKRDDQRDRHDVTDEVEVCSYRRSS